MKTAILNAFVLASLLVVVACVYLWPRSYVRSDGVFLFGGRAGTAATAAYDGDLVLCAGRLNAGENRTLTVRGFSEDTEQILNHRGELIDLLSTRWHRAGVWVGWTNGDVLQIDGASFVLLVVPLWLWLALALPWPIAWVLYRLRLRRRRRFGLCTDCGYDLRGQHGEVPRVRSPDHGAIHATGRYGRFRSTAYVITRTRIVHIPAGDSGRRGGSASGRTVRTAEATIR